MMTQIILSGHATFASGLLSAAELIVGQSSDFVAIDFNKSQEQLASELEKAFEKDDQTIVFTDLLGATPFQTAVRVSRKMNKNIYVFGGTNLSMILAAAINKGKSIEEIVSTVLYEGKQFIDYFDFNKKKRKQADKFEEGL